MAGTSPAMTTTLIQYILQPYGMIFCARKSPMMSFIICSLSIISVKPY
jgi:hypothetical protein